MKREENHMKTCQNTPNSKQKMPYAAPDATVFCASETDVLTSSLPVSGGSELPYRPFGGLLDDDSAGFRFD